jgi:NTP pyrophosphatase (non-canonical NTP hydrolase)
MTFDELEATVAKWHSDRNLLEGSTDKAQVKKLLEEAEELRSDIWHNVDAEAEPKYYKKVDLRDELGDCLVVLINIATRNNFSLYEALEYSFAKIKDRKGKMVDGLFVKEGDL